MKTINWNTIGLIAQILTPLIILLGGLIGGFWFNQKIESTKNNLQKEIIQYQTLNTLAKDFSNVFEDFLKFQDQLILKYPGQDQVIKRATRGEKDQINQSFTDINKILYQIYVIAPDDKYEFLIKNWQDGLKNSFQWRTDIMKTLRLMMYPETRFEDAGQFLKVIQRIN